MRLPLIAVTAVLAAGGPSPTCDPAWLPIVRVPDVAFFVAVVVEPTSEGFKAELQSVGARAVTLPPGPVLLVPWNYGPDCRPLPWPAGSQWTPPREAAFYTARLRPESQWIDRTPTFDVEMAWREPLWRAADPRWPHPTTGTLLSPGEFLELYGALPTPGELDQEPVKVLARIAQWATAHPQLSQREPGLTILGNIRRAAEALPQSR